MSIFCGRDRQTEGLFLQKALFYAPFFAERKVPKEAAKGGYGLFSSVKAELSPKKTMPLPPFENPQHPFLGVPFV
jgi:hypothetical protein